MRAITSAITAAFKNAFGVAVALLSWPFRALFGFGGSPARAPIPDVAPPAEIPPEAPVDHSEIYKRTAIALQTWAAESLLADGLAPAPPAWPRSVQTWSRGLTRDECFAIIDAPEHAVVKHISGVFAVPGVRTLQPLKALTWKRQGLLDPCRSSPGFAAALTEAACGPS